MASTNARISGTFVRAVEMDQLAVALEQAGIAAAPHANGLRAEVEALQIGKIAAANQITLIELRPTEGGLEDLFLELTADAQRDDLTDTEGAAG